MAWNPEFEAAFDPKAVAIVGASTEESEMNLNFTRALQVLGYQGHLYPVNRKATEDTKICGLKAYPSLVSIPEHIDLVVVSVPKHAIIDVLNDCIAAGAKNVQMFTAGFRETGEREGIELEDRIVQIARENGLNVVGPNCMGVYSPKARVGLFQDSSTVPGPVAFLSQSGGLMGEFAGLGSEYGIYFSKAVSFGNAAVMDSTDFLEYLATDPETTIITMYLEGVNKGRRFTEQVKEINKTKPVIIWKGGLTESGSRAVASHTGSLGGQEETWQAFFRQTGAVRVDSLDELRDVTMTFLYMPPPKGRRVALMGAGGGNSVAGADVCAREGLTVPPIAEETRRRLATFVPPDGTSVGNPLDIGVALRDANLLSQALEPVAADPAIDAIIYDFAVGLLVLGMGDAREGMIKYMVDFAKGNAHGTPLIMVIHRWVSGKGVVNEMHELLARFVGDGVAAYQSLQRASRAYAKFVGYHEFHGHI